MQQQDLPPIPEVSPDLAAEMLSDGALLIDVREIDEWQETRIGGAEFKPMSGINSWYADLPQDRPIVVYCHSGARSQAVVKALTEQAGMTDVHNMTGGIKAWSQLGLDLES
ncbi:MAG: rhodanese-like domain-containing protein [Acidimicrobiia bacterium]|nr:rhodanese-like domain-containing protein [Acidimicrobiia bacterium]NNF62827.1 rhodanese-like domain-containing protein [Acidimicrobiia bacterium]